MYYSKFNDEPLFRQIKLSNSLFKLLETYRCLPEYWLGYDLDLEDLEKSPFFVCKNVEDLKNVMLQMIRTTEPTDDDLDFWMSFLYSKFGDSEIKLSDTKKINHIAVVDSIAKLFAEMLTIECEYPIDDASNEIMQDYAKANPTFQAHIFKLLSNVQKIKDNS